MTTLPTLSHDEYDSLRATVDGDGGSEESYWLQAIEPERLFTEEWDAPVPGGILIEFLRVPKPHRYVTKANLAILILPIGGLLSYTLLDSLWPAASPFAFVIRENRYDELEDTDIYFRYGTDEEDGNVPLPKFDLMDWRTH